MTYRDSPDFTDTILGPISRPSRIEWQSQLSNHGATPIMLNNSETNYRGKFFPRGCRGWIESIEVYVESQHAFPLNIHIRLSPYPNMAPIHYLSPNLPAGWGPGWLTIPFNYFWSYDSLFIILQTGDDAQHWLAYDGEAPYDYYTGLTTVTFTTANRRLWIRVNLKGETAGDVPVSGTLNTIPLPNTMGMLHEYTHDDLDPAQEYTRTIITSPGRMTAFQCCIVKTVGTIVPANVEINWEIDGTIYTDTLAFYLEAVEAAVNIHAPLNFYVIDAVNERWCFAFNFPVSCRQYIRVRFRNTHGAGNSFKIATWQAAEVLR